MQSMEFPCFIYNNSLDGAEVDASVIILGVFCVAKFKYKRNCEVSFNGDILVLFKLFLGLS